MKKSYLALAAIIFAIALIACNKSDLATNSPANDENLSNPKGINVTTTANPVISFLRQDIVKRAEQTNMYVMNEDGTNKTKLMTIVPYVHRQWSYPRWAPQGINTIYYGAKGNNFTWNGGTYSSNAVWLTDISVVNNVPITSNTRKIWDGASTFTTCYDRAWNPATNSNQIAIIALNVPTQVRTIMLIPTNGVGTPTTIYTETGGMGFQWLTFSPDGQYIAFARGNSTARTIRVISATTGQVVSDYDLTQYSSVSKLDAQRTQGSNIIAFQGTQGVLNNMYNLDLVTGTASLAITNGTQTAMGSWSPDNSKMVHTAINTQWELRIYNFITGTTSGVLDINGEFSSWKR